jgi:hypothetical protein
MISDKYKCIFVEVPKTGSSSIRMIVGSSSEPHLNICQISHLIEPEKFSSYFKFGFVRNPWDRAVSLYERREGLQMRNKMSFDQFIHWMKLSSCTCIHPVPHRYQLDWFLSPHGDVMVDYIGKFETIDQDWKKISEKIGINSVLPKLNVNNERVRDYTRYYNKETMSIVSERFAVDIDYFGYKFGE